MTTSICSRLEVFSAFEAPEVVGIAHLILIRNLSDEC